MALLFLSPLGRMLAFSGAETRPPRSVGRPMADVAAQRRTLYHKQPCLRLTLLSQPPPRSYGVAAGAHLAV